MDSGKKKRIFESITEQQEWKIRTVTEESKDFDTSALEAMILSLTGIPSIDSLSKQEASFIIDKLLGKKTRKEPAEAKTEDKIKGRADDLPFLGHVCGIREGVTSLEWSLETFRQWLRKNMGTSSIKGLTRETGKKAFIMLLKLREHGLKN